MSSDETTKKMRKQVDLTVEGEPYDALVTTLMLAATAPDSAMAFDAAVLVGRLIERWSLSDVQVERAMREADTKLNEATDGRD